jgi:hypothetical protein
MRLSDAEQARDTAPQSRDGRRSRVFAHDGAPAGVKNSCVIEIN